MARVDGHSLQKDAPNKYNRAYSSLFKVFVILLSVQIVHHLGPRTNDAVTNSSIITQRFLENTADNEEDAAKPPKWFCSGKI